MDTEPLIEQPSTQEALAETERAASRRSHPLLDADFPDLEGAEHRLQEELTRARLFPRLAPVVTIARYSLLERVGKGGMGIVYAAYDPQLDRRVAIKLLLGEGDDASAESRLRREARAMARVIHPNVVTVIDVGVHDGRSFVAMEYVQGRSLERWSAEPRPWRETLAVYQQAGRGLAAAHAMGIVHRDFKPHNAMLVERGVDRGRVKVLDFGLARANGRGELDASEAHEGRPTALEATVTRTGAIMGTPAYMAPEQHDGRRADARSDQFSFCVALWEALYGERPYSGDDAPAIRRSMGAGALRAAPAGNEVPSWVRGALARGLAVEEASRWPSMEALLDALDPSARRRPRVIASIVGVSALALASGYAVFAARARSDDASRASRAAGCERAGATIYTHWSDDRSRAVQAAYAATELPYADEMWSRTKLWLDEYAQEWASLRARVCVESELEQTRDPAGRAAVDVCLDGQLSLFAELVRAMPTLDESRLSELNAKIATLPRAVDCEQGEPVLARHVPREATMRAEYRRLHAELGAARGLLTTGELDAALSRMTASEAEVTALQWEPLEADFYGLLGWIQLERGDSEEAARNLERAFFSAGRVGDDLVAAQAAHRLVVRYIAEGDGDREAMRWSELGLLFSTRLRREHGLHRATELMARGHTYIGILHMTRLRDDEALASFQRALQLIEHAPGIKPGDLLASILDNMAGILFDRGEHERGRALATRALDYVERAYGPHHPRVGIVLATLASFHLLQSEYEPAAALTERALALLESSPKPFTSERADLLTNLAITQKHAGDSESARRSYERAIALLLEHHGEEHPGLFSVYVNLGSLHLAHGEPARALEICERAQQNGESHLDAKSHILAYSTLCVGQALLALGEHDRARARIETAERLFRAAPGIKAAVHGEVHLALAHVRWAESRFDEAIELATRAREELADGSEPERLAEAEAWLEEHGPR